MSVKWEKTGKTTGDLTFDISQDEIKLGLDQAFRRVKKNLRVPGFRKGHVSRVIFDQYYGEEALYEDALNIVLPNAYSAAVKEAGIKAVGQPQIVPVSMDKDKDWTMKATVTVEPGVSLIKLSLDCAKLGLSGLEFMCALPGHMGSSVAMNAGAYKSSISDVLVSAKVLNDKLEVITMTNKELEFKYRDSFLKHHRDFLLRLICLKQV